MKIILVLIVSLLAFSAEAKFSVKNNTNMGFGTLASSVDGAGTATISPNADSKTVSGSLFDFGGSVTRAKFQVSGGTPSGFVTISLPSSFTISKSGVTLTVDQLTSSIPFPAQLDGSGKLTVYVGGRLSVPTSQTPKAGLTGGLTVTFQDDSTSNTDDATATVSASIVAPISISQTAPLNFGHISSTAVSGTLAINANGTTTATNVTQLAGSAVSQGVLSVTGEGNALFSIVLPASATLTNGSHSMTVNNFTHDRGNSPSIAGGGSRTINVGATLQVAANQAGGTYSGTYAVTVNYN